MYLSLDIRSKYANIKNKQIYLFSGFWSIIAVLEFIQDYISSLLNNTSFEILESISYKVFWLFFIPFTFFLIYGLKKIKLNFKPSYYLVCCLQIILISILHLIFFSVFLYGVSKIIHYEDSWRLSWLLTEKFSNRLYIALSIYIVSSIVYFRLKKRESIKTDIGYSKTIIVKNGRKSVIVNIDNIQWINSDGPYLLLYTTEKKHLITDSLKNIINTLPKNFMRIHRSTIVNIDRVKELKSRLNGDYDVIMKDDNVLRLSRNYTKPLKGTLL